MISTLLTDLDKRRVRHAFNRAVSSYDSAAVLHRRIGDELLDRLSVLRAAPRHILDVGCGTGYCTRRLARYYRHATVYALDLAPAMARRAARGGWFSRSRPVAGDAEALPFADASVDFVFSNLALQWCDPARALAEFARVLRPSGVLMFTSFGPDTLMELRRAWAAVDAGEHVHRFVDMHDLGDLLVNVGFAEPVMDMDRYTLTYPDVASVLGDLKSLGAGNAARARMRGLTGKQRFERFRTAYESMRTPDHVIPATYEIVYGHAWAPAARTTVSVPVTQLGRGRA